jgi:hypothetical protein
MVTLTILISALFLLGILAVLGGVLGGGYSFPTGDPTADN